MCDGISKFHAPLLSSVSHKLNYMCDCLCQVISLSLVSWLLYDYRVEGVFHRIKERLLEYGNDPLLANIKDDYIAIKLKVHNVTV